MQIFCRNVMMAAVLAAAVPAFAHDAAAPAPVSSSLRDGNPLGAEEGPLALISGKDMNNGAPRQVTAVDRGAPDRRVRPRA